MNIELQKLGQSFGQTFLFKDLNYRFDLGQIICIRGKNGSGKTTLLKTLAGLYYPSEGKVLYQAEDLHRNFKKYCSSINYLPAADNGFPERLNGFECLKLFSTLDNISLNYLNAYLEKVQLVVDLKKILNTPFFLMSSGMKQFLNILRCDLKNPPIWILDEPFRSLDEEKKKYLKDKILERKNHAIIFFTTHEADDNSQLAPDITIQL